MRKLPVFESGATLVGTVIGAGILSIPFAMSQVGFWIGTLMLIVLGGIMMLRHLMLAEITLRTPHVHQTPGYSGIYLGQGMKWFDTFVTIIARYGSMLAYTVGIGVVLQALMGGTAVFWSLVFFAAGSIAIYLGLNIIKKSELVLSSLIFLITLVIGVFSWNHLELVHLNYLKFDNITLPYGVFLFAYAGSTAIPIMREELKGKEKMMLRSIIGASLFIFCVYLLFSFMVLGVTGPGTTEVATVGLGDAIGPHMILIGNLLAFFTMATSFLTIGLGSKDTFQYDYHIRPTLAWLMTVSVPLAIFLVGARDFIQILGLTGGVLTGIQTLILILTFWQARHKGWREPEFSLGPMKFSGVLLIMVFLIGAAVTVISNL